MRTSLQLSLRQPGAESVEILRVPLASVCDIIMGQAPAGDTYNTLGNGVALIAGAGDFSGGILTPKKFTNRPTKLSEAGDIVLSIRASIGDKVWADQTYCLGRGVAALRAKSSIDSGYLWHWLTASRQTLMRKAKGATFLQVNRSDIGELLIAVPPLDEQRRIAAILDKADELRTKRRQSLVLLDALSKSIFDSMFGPNALRTGWTTAELGNVARFFGGSSLPDGLEFSGQDGGFALLKVSDMNRTGNEVRLLSSGLWSERGGSKASTCPENTIVIPKRGAAISTNKKRITTRLSVLDPNLMGIAPGPALNIEYLYSWFTAFDLGTITSGSSVPQLNKQDLAPLAISVPPMSLQDTFANRVKGLERLRHSSEIQLTKLEILFASLQHRAFTGDL